MYAVIETGGKQYRVTPGESIKVETLLGDIGAEVEFKTVAVVDGADIKMGAGTVRGTIMSHGRDQKVLVFKFKRKKQYKRTIGHRQNYTQVQVGDIVA